MMNLHLSWSEFWVWFRALGEIQRQFPRLPFTEALWGICSFGDDGVSMYYDGSFSFPSGGSGGHGDVGA